MKKYILIITGLFLVGCGDTYWGYNTVDEPVNFNGVELAKGECTELKDGWSSDFPFKAGPSDTEYGEDKPGHYAWNGEAAVKVTEAEAKKVCEKVEQTPEEKAAAAAAAEKAAADAAAAEKAAADAAAEGREVTLSLRYITYENANNQQCKFVENASLSTAEKEECWDKVAVCQQKKADLVAEQQNQEGVTCEDDAAEIGNAGTQVKVGDASVSPCKTTVVTTVCSKPKAAPAAAAGGS